ncbi:coiled-coil domain-containing protein 97 [Triplophysa rosa]|uniref:Coiled-coil domain-containing protein 97 n=1 Tax=Triplophysa rosa TaxID=992332 RepID=A0A9W7WM88_TRIRA|nr:coiled-coil domain-containing protein 97 [Triplophysa rosa]KAI7803418.1 putative coiled-coil domain-containing protein 97 [Triplophysa rosa]
MWGEIEPHTKPREGENNSVTGAQSPNSPSLMKTQLWGEIEPFPKPKRRSSEADERCSDSPDIQTEKKERKEIFGGINPRTRCPPEDDRNTQVKVETGEGCPDSPNLQDEPSSCVNAMIEAISDSGSPVKSQQLGEPDLTLEERKKVLMDQYRSKPLVFLERYQAHLKPEHTEAFSHLSGDCRVQYYCKEIQKRTSSTTVRTRIRNHRYAALRALQKEGQYFSEEQMRVRDPLLYEQYIGQYLSEEEIFERSEESMRNGPKGLADLLINSYQEKLIQNRLEEEQEREQCAEEESDEEDCDEPRQAEWEPNEDEKAMLREEFLSQMHQRFLDGKDDFNYSEVDENPDYDNLDILNRDAEERYFDDDEEEAMMQ